MRILFPYISIRLLNRDDFISIFLTKEIKYFGADKDVSHVSFAENFVQLCFRISLIVRRIDVICLNLSVYRISLTSYVLKVQSFVHLFEKQPNCLFIAWE
jgi:hypothetical protein